MKKLISIFIVFLSLSFLILNCNNNSIINPSDTSSKNTQIDGDGSGVNPNIWVGIQVMQNHQVKPCVSVIIVYDSTHFTSYGNSGWIQFTTENITSTFDVYIWVRWQNAHSTSDCGHVQIKDSNNNYLFDEPVFCTPDYHGGYNDLMTRLVNLNPNQTYYYILWYDWFGSGPSNSKK